MNNKSFHDLTANDDFLFCALMQQPGVVTSILNPLLGIDCKYTEFPAPDTNIMGRNKMVYARLLDDNHDLTYACMLCHAQPEDDPSRLAQSCETSLALMEFKRTGLIRTDKLVTVIVAAIDDSSGSLNAYNELPHSITINGEFAGYSNMFPRLIVLVTSYQLCNVPNNTAAFLDFLSGRQNQSSFASYLADLTTQMKHSSQLAELYDAEREGRETL